MGKKRTLAIILLLCVLGGLIACGRKEKEDEYTYMIKLTKRGHGMMQYQEERISPKSKEVLLNNRL